MNINSTVKLNSGHSMPIIGLGTWQLTEDTAGTVEYALKLGYRLIDTSSDYGSQKGIGEALKRTDIARQDIYLVTKVEEDDEAYQATKDYLAEMQQEYADLMLVHRPPRDGTAGEELWQSLIRAKKEGLTRDIGVSNYNEEQIQSLIDDSGDTPAVNQIEWTPFGHSDDMKKFCDSKSIVIQAYSPLTREERTDDEKLNQIARKYSKTAEQLLIRWNLQLGVVPLPKANSRDHLQQNLDVFDFQIDDDDMAALAQMNRDYSSTMTSLPYT